MINNTQRMLFDRYKEFLKKYNLITDSFSKNLYRLSAEDLAERKKKNMMLRSFSTRTMDKILPYMINQNYVLGLIDADGCILKMYGRNESLKKYELKGLQSGICLDLDHAGVNAVSLGLAEHTSLTSCGQDNKHPLLQGIAISFSPILKNKQNFYDDYECFGGFAAFMEDCSALADAEFQVLSLADSIMMQFCMVDDMLLLYENNRNALFLVDINPKNQNLAFVYYNRQLLNTFRLPDQNLYFKPLTKVFDPLPKNSSFWKLLSSQKDDVKKKIVLEANGIKKECDISVRFRKYNHLGVKSYLVSFETAEETASHVSEKIGNRATCLLQDVVGESEEIKAAVKRAGLLANTDVNAMIIGESGTGKDIFAQGIHNASPRKNKPFIVVNCGALPRDLIASELFGYEEGSFTGAKRKGNIGKFELANGGTIFLDEVGELPLELQATLLRVVEQKQFMRLGGNKMIDLDVRIISATNANIWQLIRENKYREDLFYRLSTVSLKIPPLRERKTDIVLLAQCFMKRSAERNNMCLKTLSADAKLLLSSLPWRGNVRELQNVIESVVQMYDDKTISPQMILETLDSRNLGTYEQALKENYIAYGSATANSSKEVIHRRLKPSRDDLIAVLTQCQGNKTIAAEKLGVSRRTLYRDLEKYNLLNFVFY